MYFGLCSLPHIFQLPVTCTQSFLQLLDGILLDRYLGKRIRHLIELNEVSFFGMILQVCSCLPAGNEASPVHTAGVWCDQCDRPAAGARYRSALPGSQGFHPWQASRARMENIKHRRDQH